MIPINTSFGNLTDADFEVTTQNILLRLKTEKIFTPPFAGLADLEAALTAFSEAFVQAINGDRVAIARKNAARKTVDKILIKAAGYVTMIAGDDVTIIVMAGFTARKPRSPRPSIVVPENLKVVSGSNPGEILISVDAVDGVQNYSFEYATDPLVESSIWIVELDTRSVHLVTGLKPGQKYWFRVAAVGLRGAKMYTDIVFCFVQ